SEVAPTVVRDLLASLGPASAGGQLLQLGSVLEWNGAAKITVPGVTASAANASFVGQGTGIPVRQLNVSAGVSLEPHKFATIFALTREQIEASHAEQIVRLVMADSLAAAFDAALFSNAAGSSTLPPGLLNGISGISPATGGSSVALLQDLGKLVAAVSPTSGLNIAFVCDPGTAMKLIFSAGREFDLPVFASNGVAADTIICVGLNALVSIIGEPRLDASRDVEISMDTSPPTDIAGGGGTVLKSMYQVDEVAVRFVSNVAWGLRTSAASVARSAK